MSKAIGVSFFALLVASSAQAQQIGDVFYIALEIRISRSRRRVTAPKQLFQQLGCAVLNSLVTPGNANAAMTFLRGQLSERRARTSSFRAERRVAGSWAHRPAQRQRSLSCQHRHRPKPQFAHGGEDRDLAVVSGGHRPRSEQRVGQPSRRRRLTSTVAAKNQYTVPTSSFSGTSPDYTNPYNGSDQYNYAASTNRQVFFPSTNGGTPTAPDTSPRIRRRKITRRCSTADRPQRQRRRAIQLDHPGSVQRYAFGAEHGLHRERCDLSGGHRPGADRARRQLPVEDRAGNRSVAGVQGQRRDRHLERRDRGRDDVGSTDGFDGAEIVISPLARGNAYTNDILDTHASDLVTLQNIFKVAGGGPGGYLGDVAGANSLEDLFKPGVIPSAIPEPSTWVMMGLGFAGLAGAAAFRRKLGVKSAVAC